MAGCRHQDSNLGRTNHTVLDRVRLTTLAWRRNSRIANDSANHFGTQRRESDLNTRVLADAAVPARSLTKLGKSRQGETESRIPNPRFRGGLVHQHPVTVGLNNGYLVPWKYAPSSVTQISTLPIVSMDVVSPSGTWRNASSLQAGQTFFCITPCPGVEPGTHRRGWCSRPVGSPFPRHGTLSRQDLNLDPVRPRHRSSSAELSAHMDCRDLGS